MTEFYETFLGGQVVLEGDTFSFIKYDDEHHRVAILGRPDTGSKQRNSCGLDHFAFSYNSLHDLMLVRIAMGKGTLCPKTAVWVFDAMLSLHAN